jgi:hypothetical protein
MKTDSENASLIPLETIVDRILLIRGQKVMLDGDIALLYGVSVKRLNEQVRRNRKRFPLDFMFTLKKNEISLLRSQIATSKSGPTGRGGRRYEPFVFTEQGVAMLSSVLNSERAIRVNIAIMRAFVKIRNLLATHKDLVKKLERMESKYDAQFIRIFKIIRELSSTEPVPPSHRIGFVTEKGNATMH